MAKMTLEAMALKFFGKPVDRLSEEDSTLLKAIAADLRVADPAADGEPPARGSTAFDSLALCSHMLSAAPCPFRELATTGSGPFPEIGFDDLLRSRDVRPCVMGATTEVLVIGREGWDPAVIGALLDQRSGGRLLVYSQEMLVHHWASGLDPFQEPSVLAAYGEGHPALKFLSWIGFDWPSTSVPERTIGSFMPTGTMPLVGVLRAMGYSVARDGGNASERRSVLRRVYRADQLPAGLPTEHLREWGCPSSSRRLQKMANCLAAFCVNEKKRDQAPAACRHQADLDWLKAEFHHGSMAFQWPSTDVW